MRRAFFSVISAALAMSGCGGNSSDGAPASPPPPPAASLTITATNAKPAARVAYGATMESIDTGGLVGDTGIGGSNDGGFQKPGAPAPIPGLLSAALQKVPLGPDTYDCGVSGTQTISGDLANPLTLSVGDQINVDAADCDDGLGEVINGRMEMTVAAFSGDLFSGMYLLEMDVMLIDFEVVTATDTVLSNGDSTVMVNTTGAPTVLMSISGTSMTTVSTMSSVTMTNFLTAQSVDTSVVPEPYTLDSSGTVDSSAIGGVIAYTTPVTFQGMGAAYPFAGQLLITGAGGATIRLIALDATNVRIETDTDGDGTVDSTEETTWDDIAQ